MIIERDISRYTVLSEDSVKAALKRIDENLRGGVVCLDVSGTIQGLVTDGDFRRWLLDQSVVNLDQPIGTLSNKRFIVASITDSPDVIRRLLSERVKFVPLVDRAGRMVGLARERELIEGLRIGDFVVSEEAPTFVIAEIGLNHNGSMTRAKELVDQAKEVGADCVKFQMRHAQTLFGSRTESVKLSEDLGAQYVHNLLSQFELSREQMYELFDYSKGAGLLPLCTPWDVESLRALEEYGMPAYKMASADLTNDDLLVASAMTHKPLLVSTGMATEEEIRGAVSLLQSCGVSYILLHCNSTYPAPHKDINLAYLARLAAIGGCLVGYSGHERGISVAIGAVARGAKVIEKHITVDRSLEGSDHRASLLPPSFALWWREFDKSMRPWDEEDAEPSAKVKQ